MKLINGNLVKTIVQFAKDQLDMDLEEKMVSQAIRSLRFSENIELANAVTSDNVEKIKQLLNLKDQETNEAGYGSQGTQAASSSTIKAQTTTAVNQNRRANNSAQDQNRDASAAQRRVAGSNVAATGTGAKRHDKRADPDDVQRNQNAQTAGYATQLAQQNAERIEQLVKGRR